MKRRILTGIAVILSALSFAQPVSINHYDYNTATTGAEISGDTVFITGEDGFYEYFRVVINPPIPSPCEIKIKIKKVIANDCFLNNFCTFIYPDPNFFSGCYPSDINFTTPPYLIEDPANTHIVFNPKAGVDCAGCEQMRYIVILNDVEVDSVDYVVCSTLGVEDQNYEEVSFSVYPNPANNTINISTNGTDGKSVIRISDVLGKIVLEELISENKKLDVSNFKNGVYLINIIENGFSTNSKRIVVRH